MRSGFSVENLRKNCVTLTQEPGFHGGKTWDSNWAKCESHVMYTI